MSLARQNLHLVIPIWGPSRYISAIWLLMAAIVLAWQGFVKPEKGD